MYAIKRKSGFYMALLFMLATAATAATQPLQKTIKIAAEDDWFPYSSIVPGSNNAQGFAPDLVRAVFKKRGIEVEYIVVPFARCLHYADTGEVVGCFDATKTDANKGAYYWHTPPLFYDGISIFSRRSHTRVDLTAKDLEGKSVGITIGYTYPTSFMQNKKITKYEAPSDDNLLRMLRADRVDYILLNTLPGKLRIKNNKDYSGEIKEVGLMQKDGFWLAFSKTNKDGKEMSKIFESGLQEFVKNGHYKKLYAEFIGRHDLADK